MKILTPRLKHLVKYNNLKLEVPTIINEMIKNPIKDIYLLGLEMSDSIWKNTGHKMKYMGTFQHRDTKMVFQSSYDAKINHLIKNNEIDIEYGSRITKMLFSGDMEMVNLGLELRNKLWEDYWERFIKNIYKKQIIDGEI